MSSILSLFYWIFFGDFGLLTLTPRYLFCVLFPVMIFVGFLGAILQNTRSSHQLPLIIGLGCTTAAVAVTNPMEDGLCRRRLLWLLILLIPCSSQIAIIAAFGAIVRMRVFLVYLGFILLFSVILLVFLWNMAPFHGRAVSPLSPAAEKKKIHPFTIVKEAFFSVTDTIPSFCAGSVLISTLTHFGIMEVLCDIFAPWLQSGLHLPKEAASLFILNLFKRDFGSASLLSFAESGAFNGAELVVIMVMLTFCVPCFNTTVLLFKQEKLPMAILLWLGSLCVSLFFGRLVSTILFICAF